MKIDHIYCINFFRDNQNWSNIDTLSKKLGSKIHRWTISKTAIDPCGVRMYKISSDEMIKRYHYELWNYIVINRLDNVLIIEDDIQFIPEQMKILNNCKIDSYDMISLNDQFTTPYNENHHKFKLNRSANIYGLSAYVLSFKGASKLLMEFYPDGYNISNFNLSWFTVNNTDFDSYVSNHQLIY